MRGKRSFTEARDLRRVRPVIVLAAITITLFLAMACQSSKSPTGDIVINAPANGVVRSVLVGDGAAIEKDGVIIEIAITPQTTSEQKNQPDKDAKLAIAARNDVVAAEADANRTLTELQRIEPLLKRGLASQAELDKARAQDQDAQDRLKRARDRVKSAEQQRTAPQPGLTTQVPNEEIVAIRAPAAGKVRQVNVLAGQQVTAGQPLATLSAGS